VTDGAMPLSFSMTCVDLQSQGGQWLPKNWISWLPSVQETYHVDVGKGSAVAKDLPMIDVDAMGPSPAV